jgi:hypothetical protein
VKLARLAPVVAVAVESQAGLPVARVAPVWLSFDTWQVKPVLLHY